MPPMTPTELFHEARLTEALAAQRAVVAARPEDVGERLLLCDLLAFSGDRAAVRRELESLSGAPPEVGEYVAEWHRLLHADTARHAGHPPDLYAARPDPVELRLRADCHSRCYEPDKALDLLDDADELVPWVEGFLDGRPFEGWRDADDLLGPLLEVVRGDRFAWVALEHVRKVRLEPVEQVRDILYRPATIWLDDRSTTEVFVFGVYVNSAEHPDEGIRTGAGVDWVERDGIMRALGGRTFLFGEEELTLAEFRQVEVRK